MPPLTVDLLAYIWFPARDVVEIDNQTDSFNGGTAAPPERCHNNVLTDGQRFQSNQWVIFCHLQTIA